jgi:hypothetical protein
LVFLEKFIFAELNWFLYEKVDTSTQSSSPSNHCSQDSASSTISLLVHSNIIITILQSRNFRSSMLSIIHPITVDLSSTSHTSTPNA